MAMVTSIKGKLEDLRQLQKAKVREETRRAKAQQAAPRHNKATTDPAASAVLRRKILRCFVKPSDLSRRCRQPTAMRARHWTTVITSISAPSDVRPKAQLRLIRINRQRLFAHASKSAHRRLIKAVGTLTCPKAPMYSEPIVLI
ncbi:hypothetical protein [Advenella kashmirensis]|nr:hypothetical protein [Advenella kashmirensis]